MKKILLLGLLLIHLLATPIAFATNKIAQLDFRDITVSDALKVLSDQSNLNIVASQQASKIHITLYLHNIRPLDVVDAIAKTYNLWYKHDKRANIIRLYTVQEYRMEQVEFKQEKTQIFTLKNAKNALDLADTIANLYGSRVRLSFGENQNQLVDDLYDRFERFDLIDSRTRQQFSRSSNSNNSNNSSNNSRNNKASSNRNSNNNFQNNNQNQQPSNIDEGFNNFSESLQKNSEQQNLLTGDASSMDSAILHQSPIYVSVIKRQNRVLIRTRDAEALKNINELYTQLDTESSMMMMEVRILSLDLGDDFNSLFDFKIKSPNANISGGQNATAVLTDTLTAAASAFNPALLATIVSNKFEARLQLLEKENRVTQLATPVLMTTNQEVSRIFIGEERPIITSYESSNTNTVNTATTSAVIVNNRILPVTEIRNLGTTLLLTPNINADRTVSIRILIEQSGLSPRQATIPIPLGSGLIDANIDVVQSKTFSGTIIAPDNTSIAVGGLIEEKAGDHESKVPFLGDIPLLGFFFREDAKTRGRKELVVIIRPHIIATPTETSQFNQRFMRHYSKHPKALEGDSLNIYSNPTNEHKDYKLENKFKEYPGQNIFKLLDKDNNWE